MRQAKAYVLEEPGQPLRVRDVTIPMPAAHEAIVEVRACGLCHTDLAFADGSVAPRHPLPLVLGHEVVGTVVEAGAEWASLVGRPVIVPAVLPCGECEFCMADRGNACPEQKMPGNDIHGGLATHLLVPATPLVSLDDAPEGFDVRQLSVVADAVSTAYQAACRSGLAEGDAAFVVGAGGVGSFVVQIARAMGAKVMAFDVSSERLESARAHGADHVVLVKGRSPRDVRKEAHGVASRWGVPSLRYRIFECAGTPEAQLQAYTLLQRAATLVQVGYTPGKIEIRFSNLMAFDATVHGTWGCPPEAYRRVLAMVYEGAIALAPFIEYAPMSQINALLDDMANHRLTRRMVLDPRA